MQATLKTSAEIAEAERLNFRIHAAARDGNVTLVEKLVKEDPWRARKKDDDGRVPIHWAIAHGHGEVVKLLVGVKDFDPDVKSSQDTMLKVDGSGWTPLMIAVNVKDGEELVKLLLSKGADVNEKNDSGQTAIFFAVSKNNRDIVNILLEAKPPALVRVRDKRGQYPIHRAAAIGSTPMVELLLKHNSPINATDTSGFTALHYAIAEGHGDTAVALLKAGAETDKKNSDGALAIHLSPDAKVRKFIMESAEREGLQI